MEYRKFQKINEKISTIGLGTWQYSETWGMLDYNIAKSIIASAIENGVNLIDTAAVYGKGKSEEFIGRALKDLDTRDNVFIATKIPGDFLNRDDVFRAVDKCLSRLQVDVIDLMQVHWPPLWHNFPTCGYMRALERLIELGKIRYIGLSDFPVELIEAARNCLSRHDVVSIQVRYNVVERAAEIDHIPYAERNGMMLLAWSPLAKGALTGKYTINDISKFNDLRSSDPLFFLENFKEVERLVNLLKKIGEKYNKTPSQVALNWLIMTSSTVVPIPGAKSVQQFIENIGSVGWRLSYNEWREIDDVSKNLRITYVTW
ncbi:MAG: aldo/keto reductase [Thermoprotei archaeon]|jgi:aryl-alcohol dehydrogenase-like predicted oxidoreductase